MSYFIPTMATPYALRAFLDNEIWASLLASGSVTLGELDSAAVKGEYVNIPRFNIAAAFARGDISSGSSLSFTAASTTDDKAVVLRDQSANSFYLHDEILSGENFSALLGASLGEAMALRLLGQYARMTSAALDKVDTPTSDCHILDRGANNLGIDDIQTAKTKMGDHAFVLDTMFLHSRVWNDLVQDGLTTYNGNDVFGGALLNNGRTRGLLGISNFVICDQATNTGFGTGTTTDDRYHTILSGPGAVQLSFQRMLRSEEFVDITPASSQVKIKGSMDYILHPRGIKYIGAANPADATYGSNASWDEGYNDHRQVRLVKVVSHASITA